jgi:ComF family protein
MKREIGQALTALADVVFPRSCVSCGELSESDSYKHLCTKCASHLDFVRGPSCVTCGHPFYGEVSGERVCAHCEGLHPEYARGRTAVLSRGPGRALVHELKYRRGLYVLPDMERIFSASPHILELVAGAVLVPVPLHRRKHRERGYNQSEEIARSLCAAAGRSCRIENLLERTLDTPSQTAFDRRTRLANLKNAFALREGTVITADHHYVLVDDVFTTGSTLNSCARVLRRAGALNLDVVTFGHG